MKALIIGSGEFYFPYDTSDRFVIACDGGLDHCRAHNIKPDRILGDFDSVSPDTLEFYKNNEKTVYPKKKDMTDLELGIRLAIELGADEMMITGALSSSRFDHSLCNISLLLICLEKGIKAEIINEKNRIFLLKDKCTLKKSDSYVSFLSVTPVTRGLTLKGFEYPLENYELAQGTSFCVSNSIIDEFAEVFVDSGILAVIMSND